MRFVCLTYPEIEGLAIRWDTDQAKSPEMLTAAVAAGFSEAEVLSLTVGIVEQDFPVSKFEMCRAGACALMGTNGTTLLELS